MTHTRIRTAVALGVVAAAAIVGAQQPQRAPGTLTEGVTAVLVDVVVRDRRGQPVRDLTAADFQILEDGVPQSVGAFTAFMDAKPVAPAATAAAPVPSASPAGGAPAPDERPLVTALVFD